MMQEKGMDIRTFMPRFGVINERRHQLHEVIRLSGKNILINDCDHQLVIKVASIMSARMQIYFIDNDDYFHRKMLLTESTGEYCADNDERMMFYARGVLETISKLQWSPDIVHCNGWFSVMAQIFARTIYTDNPLFAKSKIVLSLFDEGFTDDLDSNIIEKLEEQGLQKSDIKNFSGLSYTNLMQFALNYCDRLILPVEGVGGEIAEIAKQMGVEISYIEDENIANAYKEIYEDVLSK